MKCRVCTLFLTLGLLLCPSALAQEIVLSDDFEGGLGLWQTVTWGLSDSFSISPTHSFTETPLGNYPPNSTRIATMVAGANLTGYYGSSLHFWTRYQIEPAFDFCRVEASRDAEFWVPLGSLTGFDSTWQLLSYDLGAFAGLPDVRIRFSFFSDPQTGYDGIYIDDLEILGLEEDQSGPLIIHHGPAGYAGRPDAYSVYAEVWDASGVAQERLWYRADGGAFQESPPDSVVGEAYYHTIPAQGAGTLVEYYFAATDASPSLNASASDTFAYLAGRMLILDNGMAETILTASPGDQAAVRFQTHNAGYVASALVRIYTDSQHPLDSIAAYVWSDADGLPGEILAGPIPAFPASTPSDPEAWTWVDLRPALIPAPDTFHVGLTFSLSGSVPNMALDYDVPAVYLRSSLNAGSGFEAAAFGDFHIRCVVGSLTPPGVSPQLSSTPPHSAGVVVFPNPTNGMPRIYLGDRYQRGDVNLALFDLTGREIKKWHVLPSAAADRAISLNWPGGLAGGVYFVEVGFEGGLRPERLKIIYMP